MKKYYLFLTLAMIMLIATASPHNALAHERRLYQIGAKDYTFVVGFLNEPVGVDDKSGVDLAVTLGSGAPTMGPDGDMDGPPAATKPVEGLEKNLEVEVSAGNEKKILDFAPAWGMPGHYRAVFYPSIETTYAFRIFGNVGNVPINLSFPCNPSGQSPATDSAMVNVSDGVTQKSKSGAFGCPASRANITFPATAVTLSGLDQKFQGLESAAASSDAKGIAGTILGALGFAVGLGAWWRQRKR